MLCNIRNEWKAQYWFMNRLVLALVRIMVAENPESVEITCKISLNVERCAIIREKSIGKGNGSVCKADGKTSIKRSKKKMNR